MAGMAYAPYTPHERLTAPARSRPEIWRLVAGLVLATVIYVGLTSAAVAVIQILASDAMFFELSGDATTGETPVGALTLLYSFGFIIVGVGVTAQILHGRSLGSLIGPARESLRQFWVVLRALILLYIVISLIPMPAGVVPEPNLDPALWLVLLPLGLVGVILQVSAEEIAFRGYLQSQLAARFSSPLIWIGVPSALFAMGHYAPAEAGENAWLVALWAAVFGALAADLTARSGTLGPAIALHLLNNVSAILLVSPEGTLSGLALYTFPFDLSDTEALRAALPFDFAVMILGWLAARVALRR